MASLSLTGANAQIAISVFPLFPQPQQLQGFAADDIFEGDPVENVEVRMGVDGTLSGGFVFVAVQQNFALQPNSPSIPFFDQWFNAQIAAQDVFTAAGVITLKTIAKKYSMVNGFLTLYKPIPDIKKLLEPQRFRITWNSVTATVG